MWKKSIRPLVAKMYRKMIPRTPARQSPTQPADPGEVFASIHRSNAWLSDESVSGPGSTLDYTKDLREALPKLLAEFGIASMVDLPCGDFNWLRLVDLPIQKYIGGDIVPELVNQTQAKYGNATREFRVLDLTRDRLPASDLLMCRDCMIHLTYELIGRGVANILNSPIRFVLLTTYPTGENRQIPLGSFFEINLQSAPFNFPKPLAEVEDWVTGFSPRRMSLWNCDDLRSHFRNSPLTLNGVVYA